MTKTMPALLLQDSCILPDMIVDLDIVRPGSVAAAKAAMAGDRQIFTVTQKDPKAEKAGLKDLYAIGCVAEVRQILYLPEGHLRVLLEGKIRASLVGMTLGEEEKKTSDTAEVEPFAEDEVFQDGDKGISAEDGLKESDPEIEGLERTLRELFSDYAGEGAAVGDETAQLVLESTSFRELVRQIAINVDMPLKKQLTLLETRPLKKTAEQLAQILADEVDVNRFRKAFQQKVKASIDKSQREYILREQLRMIREELGEDTTENDIDRYRISCRRLKASKQVKDKIYEEINRFQNVPAQSPESQVMRGYIETLLALPWDKESSDNVDLKRAEAILNRDHYGLKKVKERILEFLAVHLMTKSKKSPILLLAGPPGTGKTSICRSIAEAMGRKYVRMSLGGVRDEAEIRGHRRTYVGAMPGRVVNALKTAGVKNPLMVLDEVDKVSSDLKGDVSSALLEVLDSEQNSHFEDHYVEIPIDLSEVTFIATANDISQIPTPLLDRMEVIEISSYTEREKFHIAKEHLVPKQMKENGLTEENFALSDGALSAIISGYTREAGVRQLEREIGRLCRRAVRMILEDHKNRVTVTGRNLKSILGNPRYLPEAINEKDEVGIARGLAWTAVGGVTLEIEVNILPGKGDYLLTGQLGDVMKESAETGISYLRSVAGDYGIKPEFFDKHDIHIHIPEGAVPKDGPSAGITMALATLSAMTGRPVKRDVAMTGEITLRGHVLPIGGLKEKLLAAKKAGVKKVLIPEKNQLDLKEIDREVTDGLTIVPVSEMSQVVKESLCTK